MDFAALVSFNRVAAHGGVGAASRATGRSKATLSRHIRQLERSLGLRLVERGTKALRLTDEGSALHARTGALLAEVEATAADVVAGARQPRGRLRASVPVLFAHMAMDRIATDFAKRYPDVRLELSADDRTVDLVREGYDVVVRVDPRPDPTLVGRRFLRDRHVVVAPPALPFPDPVACEDRGATPAVVLCGASTPPVWRVHRGGQVTEIRPEPVMSVSSLLMARDAVRSGTGAAVLPRSLVADDLAAGRLAAWGAASDRCVELWVLHTSRRLTSPKVDAFIGFLCSAFQSEAADGRITT